MKHTCPKCDRAFRTANALGLHQHWHRQAEAKVATPELTGWKEHFRTAMTRCTFHVMLTRAMLEFLCATAEDVRWDRDRYGGMLYPNCFLVTISALEKRGLIERKPRIKLADDEPFDRWPYKLTPAGAALVELLKVGELFILPEAAKAKLAARKGRN